MLKVYNYFRGNVRVEVRGAYPERFLNICSKNHIGFWDMTRSAPDIIHITVTVTDYRRLREYAKKSMCKLHIVRKTGLRFFTNRFKKRAALILGLIIFLLSAWITTSFIWVVEITGYSELDHAKLREYLKQNGVYVGAYSPHVKLDELKNDVLLNMPELSFITVNISGSQADVEVRKRIEPPEIISMDEPCNIIARRGGMINSIVVKSGTPAVKPGDVVYEGQLLAGGFMTGRSGHTISTHAIADITARTWYTIACKMPLDTQIKTHTGKIKKRNTLIIVGRRVKLFLNSRIPYEECDKIIKNTELALAESIILPLSLETETFSEYTLSDYRIPEETILEYMKKSMINYLPPAEDRENIGETFYASIENDAASVTMTAECLEDIGIKQLFPKGSDPQNNG